jgi:hypothetical protein
MKKMVPSWWYVKSKRTIAPEQGGEAKEEMSSLFTTRGEIPLELDYAQTYRMGASGAAMVRAGPPVDPSRTPRVPELAWER